MKHLKGEMKFMFYMDADILYMKMSEWKWLYVQATQKGYIWTRKAQK